MFLSWTGGHEPGAFCWRWNRCAWSVCISFKEKRVKETERWLMAFFSLLILLISHFVSIDDHLNLFLFFPPRGTSQRVFHICFHLPTSQITLPAQQCCRINCKGKKFNRAFIVHCIILLFSLYLIFPWNEMVTNKYFKIFESGKWENHC